MIANHRLDQIIAGDKPVFEIEIEQLAAEVRRRRDQPYPGSEPIPMRLPCPSCGTLHIDEGEFATKIHHTHACQACGMVWRPAIVPTVGVQFLPGFKNMERK